MWVLNIFHKFIRYMSKHISMISFRNIVENAPTELTPTSTDSKGGPPVTPLRGLAAPPLLSSHQK